MSVVQTPPQKSFTELYRVLFFKVFWSLPSFTEIYRVLPSFPYRPSEKWGKYRRPPPKKGLPSCTEFFFSKSFALYRVVPSFTEFFFCRPNGMWGNTPNEKRLPSCTEFFICCRPARRCRCRPLFGRSSFVLFCLFLSDRPSILNWAGADRLGCLPSFFLRFLFVLPGFLWDAAAAAAAALTLFFHHWKRKWESIGSATAVLPEKCMVGSNRMKETLKKSE